MTKDKQCRVILGDCSKVLPTFPDKSFDAVITDPPYNVGKNYGTSKDKMKDYDTFMAGVIKECCRIAPNQFWVAPRYKLTLFLEVFKSLGMREPHMVVIPRGASGPYRDGWSDQFCLALAIGKPVKVHSDLWKHIRLVGEGYFFTEDNHNHPGYTPLPIMRRAVELLGGNHVLDPFCGTATTGVACIEQHKEFTGIELDPAWAKVAEQRLVVAARHPAFSFGE